MRYIGSVFVLILAAGCATSPGTSSVQRQFLKEHPGAKILAETADDATEHRGFWPHNTTHRQADYTFRYASADGAEHQEIWHYKYSDCGWSVEKEQTK